jgi:putative ABC transport system permease protein
MAEFPRILYGPKAPPAGVEEKGRELRAERGISPLWRRAPTVLFRYPWLLAAIVFGALLLSFTVTAYPLFISATEANLAKAGVTNPNVTPYGAGVEYRIQNLNFRDRSFPLATIDRQFRQRIASEPLLGPATASAEGPAVSVSANGKSASAGSRLFAAPDAYRHVRVVETNHGPGAWISQLTADDLGVKPGDTVSLARSSGGPVEVPVSTVYRSLYTEPHAPYWYRWQFDIYKRCRSLDCEPPPPFILVGQSQLISLTQRLGQDYATFAWEAPVRDPSTFTLDNAIQLKGFVSRFTHDAGDESGLGRTFHCCHLAYVASMTTTMTSSIGGVITDTAKKIAPVQEPGRVLEIAAMIVALAVLAIAGWFAAAGRRVEEGLLQARGTPPRSVLLKSCVETVLPCLLGVGAGVGLAFLLIDVVRPSGLVGSSALHGIAPTAAIAVATSVLLLGITSTMSYVRAGRPPGRALGPLGRIPWEIGLIALTVFLLGRLTSGGGFVVDPVLHVRKPSPLLLAFPLVAIGGFAILGSRLFVVTMRQLRSRPSRGASSGYLAVRRLTSAPGLTVLLVAASVLCLGIFVQAQVVTRSLETTVEAKAKLFVGSDVQTQVADSSSLPTSFPLPATKVTEVLDAGTLADGSSFDLLAIDPATLQRAAYWNPAFSGLSMDEILQKLRAPGPVPPVLVAGTSGVTPTKLIVQGTGVPVRTIGTASAFPGVTSLNPLIVVSRDTFERDYDGASTFLGSSKATTSFWIKGDTATALRAVRALPFPTFLTVTANQVEDIPEFHATIYTFLVLDALGLVAALLVFAGILMYLQARFRSQVVSFGLSLRMGMTERAHRRAVVIEIATMLVFAYALGLGLAVATSLLLVSHLDPLPSIPPGPLFVNPLWVLAAGVLGVVSTSWLGGWISDRRARSVDLGEVMRLAA